MARTRYQLTFSNEIGRRIEEFGIKHGLRTEQMAARFLVRAGLEAMAGKDPDVTRNAYEAAIHHIYGRLHQINAEALARIADELGLRREEE